MNVCSYGFSIHISHNCHISSFVILLYHVTFNALFVIRGFSVVFIWVPSHVGLAGNTAADAAAEAALNLPVTN